MLPERLPREIKLTGTNKTISSHRFCASSGALEEEGIFGRCPTKSQRGSPDGSETLDSNYPDESFKYIADGVRRSAGVEAHMGTRVGRFVESNDWLRASRASATVGRISSCHGQVSQ